MAERYKDRRQWSKLGAEYKHAITQWIQEGFEEKTIEYAEEFGRFLKDNRLTTSQIRIIFGEVRRIYATLTDQKATKGIDKKSVKDFLLLKPKIAYAAKRAGTGGIEALRDVLNVAHSAVNMKMIAPTDDNKSELKLLQQRMENFVDFFEAILAYHKAAGGRDS